MIDKKSRTSSKTTNEKPVSLNPVGFEDALRGLLTIPPTDEPKAEEKAKSKTKKKPDTK